MSYGFQFAARHATTRRQGFRSRDEPHRVKHRSAAALARCAVFRDGLLVESGIRKVRDAVAGLTVRIRPLCRVFPAFEAPRASLDARAEDRNTDFLVSSGGATIPGAVNTVRCVCDTKFSAFPPKVDNLRLDRHHVDS